MSAAPLLQVVMTSADLAGLEWQDQALCAQVDPEIFYPEKGGSVRVPKRICGMCEVRAECLDYALTHEDAARFGIWGGTSERERRRLKRSGADLHPRPAAPGRAGDQLELAPPGLVPLVAGQPAAELAPQPRRVAGVAVGLDRVLRPAVAEHLKVERGHGVVLPSGLPNRNPEAC